MFPDETTARAFAIASLRDVMAGDLLAGDFNAASFVEVEDEQHRLVMTVSFGESVSVRNELHPRASRGGAAGEFSD